MSQHVTLRAASRISSEARKIVDQLVRELKTDIQIGLYVESVPTELQTATEKFTTGTKTVLELEQIIGRLRAAVGKANETAGINALLTEDAAIQKQITLLSKFSDVRNARPTSVAELTQTLASNRKRKETSESYYGGNDEVIASILTVELASEFNTQLQALKVRRQTIADELLQLNVTTKVLIKSEDVAALKLAGVVITG